jgi:hypothetical protein
MPDAILLFEAPKVNGISSARPFLEQKPSKPT